MQKLGIKPSGECKKTVWDHERENAREAKSNPKSFYAHANSKMSTKEGVADLIDKNGIQVKSDKDRAETLNDLFRSVFTEEKLGRFSHIQSKI